MEINGTVLDQLADKLHQQGYMISRREFDELARSITRQAASKSSPGIQKLNVPVATPAPAVVWGTSSGAGAGGQGVTLTPTDPGLSQIAFDLKSAKSLTAIPNELLAVSVPAVDQIVAQILALAFAQAEMNAHVCNPNTPNGPVSVYNAPSTTTLFANNGSANGGAQASARICATIWSTAGTETASSSFGIAVSDF